MKRFLSLFIAMILVFSMFATVIVFAEDDTNGGDNSGETATISRVTFNAAAFKKYIFDHQESTIEMSTTFSFYKEITYKGEDDNDETVECWYEDYDIIHEIFEGINYLILKDEDILSEDDDGYDDAQKFSVTYNYNLPVVDDDDEGDEDEDEAQGAAEDGDEGEEEDEGKLYQVTEHVKLESAPKKPDGYKFAGWSLSFDADDEDLPAEFTKDYRFAEGFEFNMLEANVTVTANWIKEVVVDDKTDEEEGSEPNEDGDSDPDAEVEEEEPMPDMYANDIIYILYTSSDNKEKMEDWERCEIDKTFSVTSKGWWNMRFAVADGVALSDSDHDFKWEEDVLATSYDDVEKEVEKQTKEKGSKLSKEEESLIIDQYDCTLRYYAVDTTHPQIKLSSSMESRQEEGLTVGTTYTISTSLDIEDAGSSTTVTYKVWKKVGSGVTGAVDGWLLIYDSSLSGDDRLVEKDYSNCISTSGVITPLEEDVSESPVYRIVYSVVDSDGYYGVDADANNLEEFHPVLELKVKAADNGGNTNKAIVVWKIILYVIAGLSAAGIVVLLCIKPKEVEVSSDARYNASKDVTEEGSDDKADE